MTIQNRLMPSAAGLPRKALNAAARPRATEITALEVVVSKDTWNGMPVLQFDFLMTPDAVANDLGTGNVRVLVSARKGCAPHVKWVWSGTKRQGWASYAYRWLVAQLGQALKVSDVCGAESCAFHREMKRIGIVAAYTTR